MTPIEKTLIELRKAIEDPLWQSFDRLANDVKGPDIGAELIWLCRYRRVLVLTLDSELITRFNDERILTSGKIVNFLSSSAAGEPTIITNDLWSRMFRHAQRVQKLSEQVINWVELSRKPT